MRKYLFLLICLLIFIQGCSTSSLLNSSSSLPIESSVNSTSSVTTISSTIQSTQTPDPLPFNPCDTYSISDIKQMTNGVSVKVCGIISAWDYDYNFYLQDDKEGIYVYGSLVPIQHKDVGKTILVEGIKDTYLGSHQIRVNKIEIIDSEYLRPAPIEVYEFSNLIEYENKLVKLINVNLDEPINQVTRIVDQSGNLVARIYYGPTIQNRKNVDVTGVLYNRTNRELSIVISDSSDVANTTPLTDSQRLQLVYFILELPEIISVKNKLPTNISGVQIEWKVNHPVISIHQGMISFNNNDEEIHLVISAILSYKTQEQLQKNMGVTIKNLPYYEYPHDYAYDGPTLSTNNQAFWKSGGGVIAATFDSCHDGDTAKFIIEGKPYTTRFLGIDTEELYHPVIGQEEWAMPASVYTCNRLMNAKEIYIQSDPGNREFDDYNRLLAWIWLDGELLQYRLVHLGLAELFYYETNRFYTSVLSTAQLEARTEMNGKWGNYLDPYWDYQNNKLKEQ